MSRWKIWYMPGHKGCGNCGSKTNGNLASPGWFSGQLWCTVCLRKAGLL